MPWSGIRSEPRSRWLALTLAAAVPFACKSDAAAPPDPPAQCQATAVSVVPSQTTVEAGKTVTLAATVSQQNCSNLQIAWTTSDASIAQVSAGVVTGVAVGSAFITASVNNLSAAAAVVVTAPAPTSLTWEYSRYVAVGQGEPPRGGPAYAITGTSATDLYAAAAGRVHRFDGTRWSVIRDGGGEVTGMWAAAPGDLFAADGPGMNRWVGGAWSHPAFGISTADVWGTGPADVFAVGWAGAIHHFDGAAWTAMSSGTTANLESVFGFSASDVWAVGHGGTVLHYDGALWTAMASGTSANLFAVWGSDPTHVFAAGSNALLRFDGNVWTPLTLPASTPATLRGIGGTGPTDVHIVGTNNTALRFDGVSVTKTTANTSGALWSVWGTGTELFASGTNVTLRYTGGEWRKLSYVPDLLGVFAFSATNALAVGDEGTVLRYNGTAWTPQNSGANAGLYSVSAAGPTEIWAVGATYPSANTIILRSNGQTWQTQTLPPASLASLYSVHATAPGQVSVAGSSGYAMRLNDGVWTYENVGVTESLRGIWGAAGNDVWAVGDNGRTVHFDGAVWQSRASGTSNRLWAVSGSAADDLWAVGQSGTLTHYDGTSWSVAPPVTTETHTAVWASGRNDVWVAGFEGGVYHFNGTAWASVVPTDFNRSLNAIHGAGGRVFAVGDGGTLAVAR